MKLNKATILLLVSIISAYFIGDTAIYGRVKNLIKIVSQLTQAVQKQNVEMKNISAQFTEKQEELNAVKGELGTIKKELEGLKAEPAETLKK